MKPSQREFTIFMAEYQNWQRIFEDSQMILKTTTHIEVFKTRLSTIREFIAWCFEQQAKGFPITINQNQADARTGVNSMCNFHAVRIAKALSEDVNTSRKALSVFDKVEELSFMLCEAPNKSEAEEEMKEINMRLIEFI